VCWGRSRPSSANSATSCKDQGEVGPGRQDAR
jgi:hypothetical protein